MKWDAIAYLPSTYKYSRIQTFYVVSMCLYQACEDVSSFIVEAIFSYLPLLWFSLQRIYF